MKEVQKPRKPLIFYYLIAIAVLLLLNSLVFPALMKPQIRQVDYSTFLSMLESHAVDPVSYTHLSIPEMTSYL